MEPLFLYQIWLAGALRAFVWALTPPTLRGKAIHLSPRQYAAALMQAYFGPNPLAWIAEILNLPVETLQSWRREPGFLLVMDWSKVQFAEFFRETVLGTDFPLHQCFTVAGEFSLWEDTLRVRLRVQLSEVFRPLLEKLSRRHRHGLSLDPHDLLLFRRLFLFFLGLEHYLPGVAGKPLSKQGLPLARDVVWPALGPEPWPQEIETNDLDRYVLPDLKEILAAKLKKTLADLHLLH
uniref:Uncharacterized protein n=1 Tax=Desulfobacca acetoxidans TaxID=60893 RepID=A0A7C3SJF9_9BACT